MLEGHRQMDYQIEPMKLSSNCYVATHVRKILTSRCILMYLFDAPFDVSYGFQPVKPIDIALPISPYAVSAEATERVRLLKDTHAAVHESLRLSKDIMTHSDTHVTEFEPGDLVYLITKGLVIKQQRDHKLRDRQLGPFKVIRKIYR